MSERLNRRGFLKLAAGGGAAILAGCRKENGNKLLEKGNKLEAVKMSKLRSLLLDKFSGVLTIDEHNNGLVITINNKHLKSTEEIELARRAIKFTNSYCEKMRIKCAINAESASEDSMSALLTSDMIRKTSADYKNEIEDHLLPYLLGVPIGGALGLYIHLIATDNLSYKLNDKINDVQRQIRSLEDKTQNAAVQDPKRLVEKKERLQKKLKSLMRRNILLKAGFPASAIAGVTGGVGLSKMLIKPKAPKVVIKLT